MLSRLLSYHLSALALVRPQALALIPTIVLFACHAVGLGALAQLARASLVWVALLLGAFLVAQFLPRGRDIFSPALYAPFFFVYAAILLRVIYLRVLGGEIPGYFDYALPDLRVLLRIDFLVVSGSAYALLILSAFVFDSRARAIVTASVITAGAVLGWAALEYFGHRTLGATASDPFAYVQMGIDLATRGTAAHRFELFRFVETTTLPWFPILHVGYHLPFDAQGDAISVWSIAGSFAYAIAYRIGGESALYLVNPLFSLLSACVSGLLAWELTRSPSRTLRVVTTMGTMALVATSNEIVNWAGVTMVDAQALVFSTLAVYCALRLYRTGSLRWAIGTGITWGGAYWIRHTQLVIALGFLPLVLFAPYPRAQKIRNVFVIGFSAFVLALPDLWYHQIYLGSWLQPESEELALFAWNAIPATLQSVGQSAFIGADFGWLLLFILLGIALFAVRAPIENVALLMWLGASLAIHLPYAALRLRDLIPELPILGFYACFGMVAPIAILWQRARARATLLAAAWLFIALELNLVRVWNTLPRVMQPAPARFGAMTQAQRGAFEIIEQTTPTHSLLGASLNSGAIDLYARRRTFRPADWSREQMLEFLSVAQDEGVSIFLLEDNASLTRVRNDFQDAYRIQRVRTLDVPLFGEGTVEHPGALWLLERKE